MTESDIAQGVAARRAALHILRVVRQGASFESALDHALATLVGADRRLAHELAAGVLRTRAALDATVQPHVKASWDRVAEDMRDILRVGAYQLTQLTRVPPYAAVNSAVELAREAHGAKSAGFVNAVLRKVAGSGGNGPARANQGTQEPAPPRHGTEPGTARAAAALAERYSHPEWLVSRWLSRHGEERTEALLRHNNTKPALSVRPIRWERNRLRDALVAEHATVDDRADSDVLIVRDAGRVDELPGFADGAFIVQDVAQARVLRYADLADGMTVWDACAAPGGKAAALATRCPVLATDLDRRRVMRLRETLARTRSLAMVSVTDATRPPLADVSVDAVLVDAPCSATGTIAKHPDARWRLRPDAIPRLAVQQAILLDAAARTVRPGGVLVYITCSLEPEENEDQVERFLTRHPEFRRDRDDLAVSPVDHGTDGAFASRLVRAE